FGKFETCGILFPAFSFLSNMRTFIRAILSFCLSVFAAGVIWATSTVDSGDKFTVSGYVGDAEAGESLIGANVYVQNQPSTGTITNAYGFYSISLEAGEHTLVFSYLGYEKLEQNVQLTENTRLNISLREGVSIEEVVVKASAQSRNVES